MKRGCGDGGGGRELFFSAEYGLLFILPIALACVGLTAAVIVRGILGPVESLYILVPVLVAVLIVFFFVLPRGVKLTPQQLIISLPIPIRIQLTDISNIVHEQDICTEHTFECKLKFATSPFNRILVQRHSGITITFSVKDPVELMNAVQAFRSGQTDYRPASTQLTSG